jgi:hypothetical protein
MMKNTLNKNPFLGIKNSDLLSKSQEVVGGVVRKKKRGRPPVDRIKRQYKMDKMIVSRLEKYALEEGRTISFIVNNAVKRLLDAIE